MKVQPSRILNEKSGFLGLSAFDMAIVGYVLVLLHSMLDPLGMTWLSFLGAAVFAYGLVAVRLRFRPRSIRDYFLHRIRRGLQ